MLTSRRKSLLVVKKKIILMLMLTIKSVTVKLMSRCDGYDVCVVATDLWISNRCLLKRILL